MSKQRVKGVIAAMLFLTLLSGIGFTAIEEIPVELDAFIESFFQKLESGKTEEAVQFMESRMIHPDEDTKRRQSFIIDLSNIEKFSGKAVGSEKLYAEYRGKSLLEIRYLRKYEEAPVIFYFLFYRPMERWFLGSVYWDRKPEALFDQD